VWLWAGRERSMRRRTEKGGIGVWEMGGGFRETREKVGKPWECERSILFSSSKEGGVCIGM